METTDVSNFRRRGFKFKLRDARMNFARPVADAAEFLVSKSLWTSANIQRLTSRDEN